MRIKTKTFIGFGISLFIVIALSINIHFVLEGFEAAFATYEEMTEDLVVAADATQSVVMLEHDIVSLFHAETENGLTTARESLSASAVQYAALQAAIQNPEHKEIVERTGPLLSDIENRLTEALDRSEAEAALIDETLNVLGPGMRKKISFVLHSAEQDGDLEAAINAGQVQEALLLARFYVQKFLNTHSPDHTACVNKEFAGIVKRLAELKATVENPARRKALREIGKTLPTYRQSFDLLVSSIGERDALLAAIDDDFSRIFEAMAMLRSSIKADQEQGTVSGETARTVAELAEMVRSVNGKAADIEQASVETRSGTENLQETVASGTKTIEDVRAQIDGFREFVKAV